MKNDKITLVKSAFKSFLSQYELVNETEIKDIISFFAFHSQIIKKFIRKQLQIHKSIKVQFCLQLLFNRFDNERIVEQIGYFSSKTKYIANINFWPEVIGEIIDQLENQLLEYSINGSGWVVQKIMRLDINIGKYCATYGGCETSKLPQVLLNKKTIICVKNKDNFCFLYAICAKLFQPRETYKRQRPSSYKNYFSRFNLKKIIFPFDIRQLEQFERQNSHLNFKINIYGFDDTSNRRMHIFPVKLSTNNGKNINLLLYNNHYYLINNFDRLNGIQGGKYHKFCLMCLMGFQTEEKLKKHQELCSYNKPKKVVMPDVNIMKFDNFSKKLGKTNLIY